MPDRRLDEQARDELASESHRHAAALAGLSVRDGPAAAEEVDRHLREVDEIMHAFVARWAGRDRSLGRVGDRTRPRV